MSHAIGELDGVADDFAFEDGLSSFAGAIEADDADLVGASGFFECDACAER
ncbi:MAG: hypothetical protein RL215_343 [Planctomycetota bacterium]